MLNLKSVCYSYSNAFGLKRISFRLKKGDILGVIGESGCGKTTLLKLIFGEIEPDEGEIYFDGTKILGPSEQLIAGREDFKYVTQDFELMPYISVIENIIKPLSRQYMDKNIKRAKALLEVLSLEGFEEKKVKYLSGGQQQRVAIAKALASTPRLLLLDEPFSHIDNFLKNQLRRKLFRFLKQENIIGIVVTHDKADVLPFSDHIMVMKDGKTLAFKSPKDLYNVPETPYIAGLFGDYNYIGANLIFQHHREPQKIIVYPQDVRLVEDKADKAKIIAVYFMGSYKKLIVKWQNEVLILHTDVDLQPKAKYRLDFDKAAILKRNTSLVV